MEDVKTKVKKYRETVKARRARQAAIVKAYDNHMPVIEIAAQQGVSTARIYKILRDAGYTPKYAAYRVGHRNADLSAQGEDGAQ
jgi:transposase